MQQAGSLVAPSGLLSCGMHVGSSSLTRDRTQAPCIGSTESYPLHHQGSPLFKSLQAKAEKELRGTWLEFGQGENIFQSTLVIFVYLLEYM